MKRLSLLLALCLNLGFASEDLGHRMAVKLVRGRVSFARPPDGTKIPLQTGMVLREMDFVYTEAASSVEIQFEDGSTLTAGESSMLNLAQVAGNLQDGLTALRLPTGSLYFRINSLKNEKASFKFETPLTSVATQGAEGGIVVWGPQAMVFLREGKAQVKRNAEGSEEKILRQLEAVIFSGESMKIKKFMTLKALDSAIIYIDNSVRLGRSMKEIFTKKKPEKKPDKAAPPPLIPPLINTVDEY